MRTPDGNTRIALTRDECETGFLAHIVCWALMTGAWPEHEIDHINGVRDDNRQTNLRQATRAQNMHNGPRLRTNTSGFAGVAWDKNGGKWIARRGGDGRFG